MIPGIYRMTPRRLRKAIEAGVFGESRVELLGGIPFVMSENPPHILASSRVHTTYFEHDFVPIVLAGAEVGRVAVADLLP